MVADKIGMAEVALRSLLPFRTCTQSQSTVEGNQHALEAGRSRERERETFFGALPVGNYKGKVGTLEGHSAGARNNLHIFQLSRLQRWKRHFTFRSRFGSGQSTGFKRPLTFVSLPLENKNVIALLYEFISDNDLGFPFGTESRYLLPVLLTIDGMQKEHTASILIIKKGSGQSRFHLH